MNQPGEIYRKLSKWSRHMNEQDFNKMWVFIGDLCTNGDPNGMILAIRGPGGSQLLSDILNSVNTSVWMNNCMTDTSEKSKLIVIYDFGSGRHDHDDATYYSLQKQKHVIVVFPVGVNIPSDIAAVAQIIDTVN